MGTSSRGPALSLTATGKPGLGKALEGLLQYPSQQIPWLRAAEVPWSGHLQHGLVTSLVGGRLWPAFL